MSKRKVTEDTWGVWANTQCSQLLSGKFFNTEAQRKGGRARPRERTQRTPVVSGITLSVLSFSVVNFLPQQKRRNKNKP